MLCVIIPMYNEEKGAARCIDAVMKIIKSRKRHISLLVVNDGSSDGTHSILKEKKKQYGAQLIVVSYAKNRGYGGALQEGIAQAIKNNFTFALFMDSDLTNDPKDIPRFMNKISDNVDCVKASRYISGGAMVGVPLYRQWISRIGNTIASLFFHMGIHDCTNGFRCVRLSLVKDIQFHEKKFAIILEELFYLKQRYARCSELPVILTARQGTASSFMYKPQVFWEYGKYAIKALCI